MTTSNTKECFRTFVGKTMRGYFNTGGDSYLIFEDGRALVFHHETGAYWVAQPNDVERAMWPVRQRLECETAALKDVIAAAGKCSGTHAGPRCADPECKQC